MSAFFGLTVIAASSSVLPAIRLSVLTTYQFSPASSERYRAAGLAATATYNRFGSLGLTAIWMRPSPCAVPGSPLVSCFHVTPPSVLLKSPLFVPLKAPFSHGPYWCDQSAAYTVFGSLGASTTSAPPV